MSSTQQKSNSSYTLQSIFGPDWKSQNEPFEASDDRVRGGASHSYMDIQSGEDGNYAWFHGTLDTKALGGAGFASQKTSTRSKVWDLSGTDGILLDLLATDGKRYTLTVSNELPEKRPDGRDTATVVYEHHFDAPTEGLLKKFVSWKEFKPCYRGKEKNDAGPLDTGSIRRWRFMMRSFFDQQQGEFSLKIRCVCAYAEKRKEDDKGSKGKANFKS